MKLRTDPSSSRSPIYREYFGDFTPASARRILLYFVVALLGFEGAARLIPAHHWRTPISSLHGVRYLFQDAVRLPGPKVVAVGDSALVGGGVHDHDKTFMGQLALAEGADAKVFNLGIPGGEDASSLLILDALNQQQAKGISRVIIEVLPPKFFTSGPGGRGPDSSSVDELQRFIPDVRPAAFNVPFKPLSTSEATEARAEYDFGLVSAAYRDRDYLRIEQMGGYPSFWAAAKLMPARLREKVLAQKGRGTNRLGARMEDGAFDPATREPSDGVFFAQEPQGTYLKEAIGAAQKLTGRPPILLEFPFHYDYNVLSSQGLAETLETLREVDGYLDGLARQTGSTVVRVDSTTFQNPEWWTRTIAHPSTAGHLEIWRRVGPKLLQVLR